MSSYCPSWKAGVRFSQGGKFSSAVAASHWRLLQDWVGGDAMGNASCCRFVSTRSTFFKRCKTCANYWNWCNRATWTSNDWWRLWNVNQTCPEPTYPEPYWGKRSNLLLHETHEPTMTNPLRMSLTFSRFCISRFEAYFTTRVLLFHQWLLLYGQWGITSWWVERTSTNMKGDEHPERRCLWRTCFWHPAMMGGTFWPNSCNPRPQAKQATDGFCVSPISGTAYGGQPLFAPFCPSGLECSPTLL